MASTANARKRLVNQKVKRFAYRALLILAVLVVCVSALLYYLKLYQSGGSDIADIVSLAMSLTVTFFAFTFLMATAGVTVPVRL
jgi:uncharacterized membrane protein